MAGVNQVANCSEKIGMTSRPEYIVEMNAITKQFPGVLALDHVSFHLRSGEVMALLGENGAGKSTLVKILSGVYSRDGGTMRIFGQEVGQLAPHEAQELGIAIIHQELNLCPHLSVTENIFLGREKRHGILLSKRRMRAESVEILKRLHLNLDPSTIVGDLAVSMQQMVEIAKALSADARILIMDEPTSALSSAEIKQLFSIVRELRAKGLGIIYISHRLEELSHIVDRVTIMRDGHFITEADFKELSMSQIIAHMVGREIREQFPRFECPRGEKRLEVRHLNAGRMVRDICFSLYAGEIVGVAGLMGAGRTELTRALFGIDAKESGEILLNGKTINICCPMDSIRAGIVLAPEDRQKDGLCTKLSVKDNIALANLDRICRKNSTVNRRQERELVENAVASLKIKLPDIYVDSGALSGGNQQKVVIAKWMARNSQVIIFDEPTRGIDVAAKVEIYHIMNRLKSEGTAVLFVSSEMPEILGISDRILVMCDGQITGELTRGEATQDRILELATQFERLGEMPDEIQ